MEVVRYGTQYRQDTYLWDIDRGPILPYLK